MVTKVVGVESTNPRLPQTVIDATFGSGSGAGPATAAGNGPPVNTIVSYTSEGFAALVTKDPNTLYFVQSSTGGQGSLYLGTTLIIGTQLSIPGEPSNVVATPGDTQAIITWGPPAVSGGLAVSSYVVQRSLNDTTGFTTIATPSAATFNYTSTGLTNGVKYYWRVRAVNAVGNGPFSTPVSATPVTASAIVLASDDLTADANTPVTFTATITSGGSPIAAVGTVTFRRAGSIISGVAVEAGGTASFTVSTIPVGSWAITAEYDGGGTYLPSTSNTLTQVIQFPGGPAATASSLTSDDASSNPSQTVTFSCAVVRTSTGAPVNSGTVLFKDGGVAMTSPRAINPTTGIATYSTAVLTNGTHTITAEYTGAPFYGPSTSNSVTQVVAVGTGGASISQAIYVSKPLSIEGDVVSLRTTVKSGVTAVTVGEVEFFDGVTSLGNGSDLNIFGESTLVLTNWTLGTHSISAQYHEPGGSFEDDTSSPAPLVVASSLTTPSPNTWEAAFATSDLATITAWYEYNTGHLTGGFTNADLWNPAGGGSNAQVNIDAAWLAANVGPNVVNDGGGHWTITGLYTTRLSLRVSHLTLNHCWIHRLDYENVWGPGMEVRDPSIPDPKEDGVTLGDFEFNYCTFSTDGTGGSSTYGDAMYFNPAVVHADDLVFNYCEVTMWTAGFKVVYGTTVNYCWVHDLNLFGFDPHNTSGSIRGRECRFYRNLMTDGTSSSVSLYADTNPYTDFWVIENTMWVVPSHATAEINFPNRATGLSPLSPGYVREFIGNKFQRGFGNGDNNYWSKVAGNSQLTTRYPLYGGADPVQTPNLPSLLAGISTGLTSFGSAAQSMSTYHFTPSPDSTQLCFMMIGRAGTTLNPSIAITDEAGDVWLPVTGCDTPIELANGGGGAGPTIYAASGHIWYDITGPGPQTTRRITIDPYTSNNVAYMAALVVELTDVPGLTLVQAPVMSAAGHQYGFGVSVPSLTSGALALNATPGNVVLCFVGYNHETIGEPVTPDGWNKMGGNVDIRTSAACFWRDDFGSKTVTIPEFPPDTGVAVTIMIEVAV